MRKQLPNLLIDLLNDVKSVYRVCIVEYIPFSEICDPVDHIIVGRSCIGRAPECVLDTISDLVGKVGKRAESCGLHGK